MKRIAIIGSGGAGKSTLARALGEKLDLPVVHLDAVFWQPGWVEPDRGWADRTMVELTQQNDWIIDGNYGRTMAVRLAAADTVIFLDFPRLLCLFRVVKRRLQFAGRTRPDMAPGCPEKADLPFLRWVWDYPRTNRPAVLEKLRECRARGKTVVHLRGPAQARRWLGSLLS